MGIPNPDVTQQPRKQTVEALEFTFSAADCLRINPHGQHRPSQTTALFLNLASSVHQWTHAFTGGKTDKSARGLYRDCRGRVKRDV